MKPAWKPTSIKSISEGRPTTAFVYDAGKWRFVEKGKTEFLPNVPDDEILAALNPE